MPVDHPWREKLICYDTIDSTNTRAKALAAQDAAHGTVLIADRQTGGRGRMGRSFQSPGAMGVYMSVILRPGCSPRELMHLTCAAAVAACEAVEKAVGIRPDIKWTNDLVYSRRKIAGILTELVTIGTECCAVVGIGVNCCQEASDFPEDIRGIAGSLSMITGQQTDRAKVAAALIEAFTWLGSDLLTCKEEMLEAYRARCITLGKDISLLRGDEVRHGHAVSVDDEGALVVRFADGHTEAVNSGEVSVRGMYGYIC